MRIAYVAVGCKTRFTYIYTHLYTYMYVHTYIHGCVCAGSLTQLLNGLSVHIIYCIPDQDACRPSKKQHLIFPKEGRSKLRF